MDPLLTNNKTCGIGGQDLWWFQVVVVAAISGGLGGWDSWRWWLRTMVVVAKNALIFFDEHTNCDFSCIDSVVGISMH
jgi:hypothetical protein